MGSKLQTLRKAGNELLPLPANIFLVLGEVAIEAKALKAELRTAEKKKDELVEQARVQISREEARDEILKRFHRIVQDTYRHYLEADRRAVTAAIETLHDKYAVTLRDIEDQRASAASVLGRYLKALGYV